MLTQDWIDVSAPLHTGMVVWPGNPAVEVERILTIEGGDSCNVSRISLGAHTGTHVDAPIHFLPDGAGVHEAPFEAMIGPARVIEIHDTVSIKVAELEGHHIQPGERILFKTANSPRCWQTGRFVDDFVYVSATAADYLAALPVQTVGVDYLSVGGFYADGQETHQALLSAGVWVIEGLNLTGVRPGSYQLLCLPLRLTDADGAPARVLLQPIGQ
ncbi:MAG: arylformamidase [Chloroflexi bacterium]|nr:MAG: arylformamidase [Chloroflexota bacterium]